MLLLYSLINFIYQVIKKNFLKMCSHLWWLESEAFNVHIQINEKKIDETFFSRLSSFLYITIAQVQIFCFNSFTIKDLQLSDW